MYSGDGSISQSIPTTAGDQYGISFWLAPNAAFGDVSASFGADVGYSATSPHGNPFLFISFDAIAGASSTLFEFAGSGVSSTYWIDDVSVTGLGAVVPPVAEPGSLTLFASGVAWFVTMRRRNRA